MSRGKFIVTAKFYSSVTGDVAYGMRTILIFSNIRDQNGKLISRAAKMKMSNMAALINFKKGRTYRFKLSESITYGDDWLWHPVMIEDQNVRYSIKNENSVMRELRTRTCVHVTENFTAVDRAKKRYTLPLSNW